ncbi:hypothetical protein FH972_021032 [Carpinus fangiana]|uniref:ZW10 C-terminal helical domain-containing protein n=1 Tax=Carpinus fangiana TaxID=176857 RepID=A0A5N6KNJ0_9ROSI|nr:hypothetical protein FH972_021032 [Carpinus fangiana]
MSERVGTRLMTELMTIESRRRTTVTNGLLVICKTGQDSSRRVRQVQESARPCSRCSLVAVSRHVRGADCGGGGCPASQADTESWKAALGTHFLPRRVSIAQAHAAMPATVGDDDLSAAVLRSVESGAYPDSESIASAELPTTALPAILKGLNEARNRTRAKQLQVDIEESRATAQAIVKQAQDAENLRLQHDDATKKTALLRGELDFNTKLEGILEDVRDLAAELRTAQEALKLGKLEDGLRQLQHIEASLATFASISTTAPVEILQQRTDRLKSSLLEQVQSQWDEAFQFNRSTGTLAICQDSNVGALPMDTLVDVSGRLGLIEDSMQRFCRDLNDVILVPRLEPALNRASAALEFGDHTISVTNPVSSKGASSEMEDILRLAETLKQWMPFATERISKTLMPTITARLLLHRLNPLVPVSVDSVGEYQALLARVKDFADKLNSIGWQGTADLQEWANQAPRIWLAKRREATLEGIRALLSKGLHQRKAVERVETQLVSRGDVIPPQDAAGDDWNDWKDDEDTAETAETLADAPTVDDAVDESAWGWDEDGQAGADATEANAKAANGHDEHDDEDESAAWGWDEQPVQEVPPSPQKPRKPAAKENGHAAPPQERELTLRESYTTTAVPDELLAMIVQIAQDADRLRQPEFADAPVADAVVGLFSIPTLALAGFRALAPTFYQNLAAGNMLLYNDSVRLAEELKSFSGKQSAADAASQQPEKSWPSTRMKLDAEITALESFSRRAYGKEMDAQRTVLRDLLDGTQGFANCAEAPFASECENAVDMTADRVRAVAAEWSSILSRSALLQSLGSLLSTVINKMIADIEDMSDIAEDESKQLRRFCTDMSKLSDLFTQQNEKGEQSDMTGVYTPNWFKFQYLSEIMESSLADIKYLWNEGELRLEFEPDEIVDLVEALFAESDLRRRAIAEIRRG